MDSRIHPDLDKNLVRANEFCRNSEGKLHPDMIVQVSYPVLYIGYKAKGVHLHPIDLNRSSEDVEKDVKAMVEFCKKRLSPWT